MSVFSKLARDIYAPVTAGGSPRGADMGDAATWGTEVERLIQDGFSNSGLVYDTKAGLIGNLAPENNASAWVVNDPVAVNNGIWIKDGASGTGTWVRAADLPYSFVKLVDAGAGTANAIQVTSSIPTSSSVLRTANVHEANAGNVTVAENGGAAKPLLTASGNQIAPGGLIAGMMIAYLDDGANFRLLSDQASAAIQAAAEAAQIGADADADRAEAAATVASGAMTTLLDPQFSTLTTAQAYSPVAAPDYIRTSGYAAAGDGGDAIYKKVASEPTHAGKFSITLSDGTTTVWYELSGRIDTRALGGSASNTAAQNKTALQAAIAVCDALGGGEILNHDDFGWNPYDLSTAPDFTGVTHDMVVEDRSFSTVAFPSPGRQGWQTKYFMYTPQTTPHGQHDGNGLRVMADWHPNIAIDATPEDIPVGTRPDDYNVRASYFFMLRGRPIYQFGMGQASGDLPDEALMDLGIGVYNYDGTSRDGVLFYDYDARAIGLGTATLAPGASIHLKQPVADGLAAGMLEGASTKTSFIIRNTTGLLADVWVENDNGNYNVYFPASGNALTINGATRAATFAGAISKASGTFDIPHPDPSKPKGSRLRHSFVESPTRGDNIYRFSVGVGSDLETTVDLPDYWPFLNENPQTWVNEVEGFGRGFAKVSDDKTSMLVKVEHAGTYNVLLIGTRCDEIAKTNFDPLGVEYVKSEAD